MATKSADPARLIDLAERLDLMTEDDLMLLAKVTPSTVESWRRRGQGPAFILAGNRYLYPFQTVRTWLASQLRERNHEAKAQL